MIQPDVVLQCRTACSIMSPVACCISGIRMESAPCNQEHRVSLRLLSPETDSVTYDNGQFW